MDTDNVQLAILIGNIFSRVQELKVMLQQMAENCECQGEFRLTHQSNAGEITPLVMHIDGTDFTMMTDQPGKFRLDISGSSLWLE